jgi:uncharacterized surface anchored protein
MKAEERGVLVHGSFVTAGREKILSSLPLTVGNAGSTPAGITNKNRMPRIGRYRFFLFVMAILLANVTGCSYLQGTPPNGKISVQAVSWKLVKKLAEPNAGLSGHKVSVLNPADRSVVASGTTDSTGIIEFDLPPGTYTLVGASDEPQSVQLQSGQTANFKIVVH